MSEVLTRLMGSVRVKASRKRTLLAHLERKENMDPRLSMAVRAGKLREGGREKVELPAAGEKERKALEKKRRVAGRKPILTPYWKLFELLLLL